MEYIDGCRENWFNYNVNNVLVMPLCLEILHIYKRRRILINYFIVFDYRTDLLAPIKLWIFYKLNLFKALGRFHRISKQILYKNSIRVSQNLISIYF